MTSCAIIPIWISVLYLICRARKSQSCQVLAIDQRNDCVTNLVALAGAYIGHRWWKYADPIGAFLVRSVHLLKDYLTF